MEPGGVNHPSVVHCLVARGTLVLAEFSISTHQFSSDEECDFSEICRKVLGRIPRTATSTRNRKSYVYSSYTFSYLQDNELTFLCVTDQQAGSEMPFRFLSDVRQKYILLVGRSRAQPLARELTIALKSLVEHFNSEDGGSGSAKVKRVEKQLEHTANVMKDNIGKVMQRGEHIECLVDRTANLHDEMRQFRFASRQLKRRMIWGSWRHFAAMALVCLGAIFVIFSIIRSSSPLSGIWSFVFGGTPETVEFLGK